MSSLNPFVEGAWALVEQLGYKKLAGLVTEVDIAGVKMLRVDVPKTERNDEETQFVGAGSLYNITVTTEEKIREFLVPYRPKLSAGPVFTPGEYVPSPSEDDGGIETHGGFLDDDDEDEEHATYTEATNPL